MLELGASWPAARDRGSLRLRSGPPIRGYLDESQRYLRHAVVSQADLVRRVL